MARKKKVGKGHNSQQMLRADIIRAVCAERQRLLDQRAAINEQLKALMNSQVKGDLGMKIADFSVAFRLYQLERDDRDSLLDTIKECFQALGIGEQLDWLDAVAKDGPTLVAEPEPGEPTDFEAGDGGPLPDELCFSAEQEPIPPFGERVQDAAETEPAPWEQTGVIDGKTPSNGGTVFEAGRLAALDGLAAIANPYEDSENPASSKLWLKGHAKGLKQLQAAHDAPAADDVSTAIN